MEKIEDFFEFLDTVSDEYKDVVCYGSTTRNEMLFKIYDYLWENSKYFNSLSVEQMNELYNSVLEYAKTLIPKFSDLDMGVDSGDADARTVSIYYDDAEEKIIIEKKK